MKGRVIESGEVTYTSQYRIQTENTTIIHRTDTHMLIMFKSIKRRTDQNIRQKIETHILGLGQHTRCPQVSDDHTARPRPKNQYICPESPSIINATYNDGHRVRPRTFQANTVAYRATGRSLYKYIFHSFTLVPLLRQSPSILRQPLFFLSHVVLIHINR